MFGVAVGTAALIIVLSVYNGFDTIIQSLFGDFDPDFRVEAAQGKTFKLSDKKLQEIAAWPEVEYMSESLEEMVWLEYNNAQHLAYLKGVRPDYYKMNGLNEHLVDGDFTLHRNGLNFALIGYGVAEVLSAGVHFATPIHIWIPRRDAKVSFDVSQALNQKSIFPSGIFAIHPDYDSRYVIVSMDFARELLEYQTEYSAIELKIKNYDQQSSAFQQKLQLYLGSEFKVKNRYQQHEMLYKLIKAERWVIFLILSFIIFIASFNIVGSLSMLIIEKKQDIQTFRNMGAQAQQIRQIFFLEGWLISVVGAATGLILGGVVSWLQMEYGIIAFPNNQAFLINVYPVDIKLTDFVAVMLTVLVIGWLVAWYPVRLLSNKIFNMN